MPRCVRSKVSQPPELLVPFMGYSTLWSSSPKIEIIHRLESLWFSLGGQIAQVSEMVRYSANASPSVQASAPTPHSHDCKLRSQTEPPATKLIRWDPRRYKTEKKKQVRHGIQTRPKRKKETRIQNKVKVSTYKQTKTNKQNNENIMQNSTKAYK